MSPPRRILYAGMKADYGDIRRGLSFEERNFHDSLRRIPGIAVTQFDFFRLSEEAGREAMSRELVETVRRECPDLLFFVGFDEEHDPTREAMLEITEETGTATMLWVCDDHWRFEDYSSQWVPVLDWIVTTDEDSLPKYERIGRREQVIQSQWAVNPALYRPTFDEKTIDVSFVGQPHGDRRNVIDRLRREGFRIEVFGFGWGEEARRIPFHQMIRIFSRSRVNLNLNNSSNHDSLQIKGRNFEVPGCQAFLLTHEAPHLERYFDIGREIATFADTEDLVRKVQHYLCNEGERRAVATRGYARCMLEHTWEHRFLAIFDRIGLFRGSAKFMGEKQGLGV